MRLGFFEPYCFDGEWDTQCEVINGAIKDFNVFYKKNSGINPEVTVVQTTTEYSPFLLDGNSFLHLLTGELELSLQEQPNDQSQIEMHTVQMSANMSALTHQQVKITCKQPANFLVVKGIVPV